MVVTCLQEAVKKRAEMLKRKERDEKTGNATGHSRAPEEKKLRLDQTQVSSPDILWRNHRGLCKVFSAPAAQTLHVITMTFSCLSMDVHT